MSGNLWLMFALTQRKKFSSSQSYFFVIAKKCEGLRFLTK